MERNNLSANERALLRAASLGEKCSFAREHLDGGKSVITIAYDGGQATVTTDKSGFCCDCSAYVNIVRADPKYLCEHLILAGCEFGVNDVFKKDVIVTKQAIDDYLWLIDNIELDSGFNVVCDLTGGSWCVGEAKVGLVSGKDTLVCNCELARRVYRLTSIAYFCGHIQAVLDSRR